MQEQIKNIPIKPYCGKYAWFNRETGKDYTFFCGLSTCGREYCQKLSYFRRVILISDLIKEYGLNRFFTLTMNREVSRREAWKQVPYVWNKTRTILRRKYPGMKYCSILEAHKSGYPHMHGFINVYIHQREWSKTFAACGGGSYVWVEKVRDGDIEDYVTKQLNVARYVGKEQVITARQMVKPKARTFWRSENMKTERERKRETKEKTGFVLVTEQMYEETEKGFDKMFQVVYDESRGSFYLVRRVSVPRKE